MLFPPSGIIGSCFGDSSTTIGSAHRIALFHHASILSETKTKEGFMLGVPLNVFSLYAGKKSADLASLVCNSLREKLGAAFQMSQSTWNAELLKNRKLRVLAAREAVQSDVVIMATPECDELPKEIRNWFELWRNRRRAAPSALVALLKREHAGTPHVLEKELQALAASAHMDFFCHSELDRTDAEERRIAKLDVVWPEFHDDFRLGVACQSEREAESEARP